MSLAPFASASARASLPVDNIDGSLEPGQLLVMPVQTPGVPPALHSHTLADTLQRYAEHNSAMTMHRRQGYGDQLQHQSDRGAVRSVMQVRGMLDARPLPEAGPSSDYIGLLELEPSRATVTQSYNPRSLGNAPSVEDLRKRTMNMTQVQPVHHNAAFE